MKSKIFYPALFFLLGIILFSSCRKDDRPAQLNTDTSKIVFIKGETTQYFGIVNTGHNALNYQISSHQSYINASPSSGVLGFNEMAKIEVTANTSGLEHGIHSAVLNIESNVGNRDIDIEIYKPLPNSAQLWWDIDYIKIPTSSDKDYITIKNTGEEILSYELNSPSSWIGFSQNSGYLEAGQEEVVWVEVDRSGLSNDLYSGVVNISSNGGFGQVDVDMEVGVYSVTFFNPTYTVIDINVPGIGAKTIPVLNRVNYKYTSNPGSITYIAATKGETVNNQTLGLLINWQENINLSNETSPIFDLNISEDFFFLSVINSGIHDLDNWSINYDTDYQFDEDVLIPNDGGEYYFGYYDALNNSNVYASIIGTSNDAVWENGREFDFPWVMNQSILLESNLKSTPTKSIRTLSGTKQQASAIKISDNSRIKPRMRNSISLINKK